jgi:hypothetical protein
LKKFNDERKARQLAEDKSIEIEKQLKIISSDYKYLKEDLIKKEKDHNDELTKNLSLKRDFEHELIKRNQELSDLSAEISNFKIKEKHLNKISHDLKEENSHLKEECDKLRKITLDTENTKIKKLQEEIEELKTMNQLYRSQRLESDEEISSLFREKDKVKLEFNQSKKE